MNYFLQVSLNVRRREGSEIVDRTLWLPSEPSGNVALVQQVEHQFDPWKIRARVLFFRVTITFVIAIRISLFLGAD